MLNYVTSNQICVVVNFFDGCQKLPGMLNLEFVPRKQRHADLTSSLPIHIIYLMEDVDAVVAAQAYVRGQGKKWRVTKAFNNRKLP